MGKRFSSRGLQFSSFARTVQRPVLNHLLTADVNQANDLCSKAKRKQSCLAASGGRQTMYAERNRLGSQDIKQFAVAQPGEPFRNIFASRRKQIETLSGPGLQTRHRQPKRPFPVVSEAIKECYQGIGILIDRSIIPNSQQFVIG